MNAIKPVVVGAGPAGIRAAETLVKGGLVPTIIDESHWPGGQIYRQQPPNFKRSKEKLYGFEHKKADRLHRVMHDLSSRIDYRPRTLVWNVSGHTLDLIQDGQQSALDFTHLILATGATDRVLPFEGWTTPGVYTLGASQIALKFQGMAIGRATAFVGTGPLLYLVAYQYARAGAAVAAVLDTSTAFDHVSALPGLMRTPDLLAKGLFYMSYLRARRIPILTGVRPFAVEGKERVEGLTVRDTSGGKDRHVACDAIGYGLGLRSENQLSSLLGCQFDFNVRDRAWAPRRDSAGRSSISNVYLAGDGAGIRGADAAERSGERAAWALLEGMGKPFDTARTEALDRQLARIDRSREALEKAFPFPADMALTVGDGVLVCRCEEIDAGAIRRACRDDSVGEMNRLKALTRVGMGRCQGRMCGAGTAEILAQARCSQIAEVERLRVQPPIKPVPIAWRNFQSFAQQDAKS